MASTRKRIWPWAVAALAVLGGGFWISHRYQVFVVKTLGGATGMSYVRGPSKWFATKAAAMTYASGQMGGVDFVVAIVADRNGGVLEGFHGHFLTGEELDSIIASAEKSGLKLDNMAAA